MRSRGKALAPSTRAERISILRMFFRDLQEWDLIPRRFDPARSLTTPKSLLALIGPKPRHGRQILSQGLALSGLKLPHEMLHCLLYEHLRGVLAQRPALLVG